MTTLYEIAIDGAPTAVRESLDEAKRAAIGLAGGHRAVFITVISGGARPPVPNTGVYWDYEANDGEGAWVLTATPNIRDAKPRSR